MFVTYYFAKNETVEQAHLVIFLQVAVVEQWGHGEVIEESEKRPGTFTTAAARSSRSIFAVQLQRQIKMLESTICEKK